MWKFDFCELLLFSTDSFGDWVGRCSSFIFLGCVLKISLTPQCSHLQTPLLEPDGQYGLAFKHGEQWHPASCDGSSQEFVGFKRGKLASRKRPFTLLTPPSGVSSVRFRAARMWRFWEISLLLPVRQTDAENVLSAISPPQSAHISLGAGLLSNHRSQLFLGFVPLRCAIRFYYTEVILTELWNGDAAPPHPATVTSDWGASYRWGVSSMSSVEEALLHLWTLLLHQLSGGYVLQLPPSPLWCSINNVFMTKCDQIRVTVEFINVFNGLETSKRHKLTLSCVFTGGSIKSS